MVAVQVRHGDVLVESVDSLPAGAVEVPRTPAGVILAKGSSTGHSHRITSPTAKGYMVGDTMYVVVEGGDAEIIHEEHRTATLPEGVYQVVHQVEAWGDELRAVID